MKSILSVSIILLLLLLSERAQAQQDTTRLSTFIILRHAEKENSVNLDPPLTPEGKQQAAVLAALLADQPIAGIYSTTYRRTQDTVMPLAQAKGLPVQYYEPLQASNMLKQYMETPESGAIVIVGHSNTVPDLINTLLGRQAVSSMSEEVYGLVFVVTVDASGDKGSLVTLRLPDVGQTERK